MNVSRLAMVALALAINSPVSAQPVGPVRALAPEPTAHVLPRNTPVRLALNEALSSRSSRLKKGDTFSMTVAQNVRLGRYIVIPRGTRAVGTVAWRTGKGAFGKSGKMELSLDYIELGEERIPLEGKHREEGEGNSTATIATFALVSMLGSAFITGHSADLPAGHEFTAWTKEEVPVIFPDAEGNAPIPTNGAVVATPIPGLSKPINSAPAAPMFGNGHVRCVTCR